MAVALKTNFETLTVTKRILGCNREIILSGKKVPVVDNYLAYTDKVLIRFRIKLVDRREETAYTLKELREIFSDFFFIKVPEGRTELCRCLIADNCYLDFCYHCFEEAIAQTLYEKIRKDFFNEG